MICFKFYLCPLGQISIRFSIKELYEDAIFDLGVGC